RIRTWTKGSKDPCAAITPGGSGVNAIRSGARDSTPGGLGQHRQRMRRSVPDALVLRQACERGVPFRAGRKEREGGAPAAREERESRAGLAEGAQRARHLWVAGRHGGLEVV